MKSFAAALVQAMQEQAALVQTVEEQVRQQSRVCCYRLLDWSCLLFCKSEFATASNDAWCRVATVGLLSKLIIFFTCHRCWEVRRMTCDATKTIVYAAPQLTEPLLLEFKNVMSAVAEKLRNSKLSETDHSLDTQVPFLSSVEVSVKALITISSVALPAAPSASMRVLLCAHHPYLVGTTNGDAVWKRIQKYMHARNFDIMSIILADLENLFKVELARTFFNDGRPLDLEGLKI